MKVQSNYAQNLYSQGTAGESVKSAEFSQELEKKKTHFDGFAPNAPKAVKDAWNEASQKAGVQVAADGRLSHIDAMFVLGFEQRVQGATGDVMGNSIASAKNAAQKAIERLKNPLDGRPLSDCQKKDLEMYQIFLEILNQY